MTRLLFPAVTAVACAAPLPALAQPAIRPAPGRCADHAAEAATRARLPVEIVMRVMRAESGGNAGVVSSKGAMGCMQIMPATWAYLTRRHQLGSDPFDPRMNMIGGALYLAELAQRYGFPGAYAAYNAGPGRYERYVANGAPLPAETVAYTARLAGGAAARAAVPIAPRWQEASLFMPPPTPRATAATTGDDAEDRTVTRAPAGLFPLAASAPRDGSD